jgi:hypothetical protein
MKKPITTEQRSFDRAVKRAVRAALARRDMLSTARAWRVNPANYGNACVAARRADDALTEEDIEILRKIVGEVPQ